MRRKMMLLLAIFLSSCSSYKEEVITIDGKQLLILEAENYFAKAEGIRPFEKSSKNKYDGLLFHTTKDTAFTTKGVKGYLLICSLEKIGDKTFKTKKCECVKPETPRYYPNAEFVYERLFLDETCTFQIKL